MKSKSWFYIMLLMVFFALVASFIVDCAYRLNTGVWLSTRMVEYIALLMWMVKFSTMFVQANGKDPSKVLHSIIAGLFAMFISWLMPIVPGASSAYDVHNLNVQFLFISGLIIWFVETAGWYAFLDVAMYKLKGQPLEAVQS